MMPNLFLIINKNKKKIFIGLLLLLNILIMLSFGIRKNGYNVDELYTYGLSNSYFDPFIDITENTKLSNEYIQDYFTVQENEKFAFDSVYSNQSRDVHPPLYYFFFHFISSFFPNEFTKWIGIALNMIFFIVAWLLLYKLSKLIMKNELLSLIPPVLWGVSSGAVSSVVFIRMYVLMTVLVLLTTYLHVKTIKKQVFRRKDLLWILLATFLGVMTHYYFVVFAFFLSAYYFFYLLFHKRIKYLFGYVISMFSALGLSVLFYPAMLTHIFSGYRGTEAVSNISNSLDTFTVFFNNFWAYYSILNQSLFSGLLNYLLIIISCLIIIGVIKKRYLKFKYPEKNNKIIFKNNISNKHVQATLIIMIMLIFSVSMYVFIIAQVAPYKADRYVFPMFPLVILVFVYIIQKSISVFTTSKLLKTGVFGIFITISLLVTYTNNTVNYLYEDREMDYLRESSYINQEEAAILIYNKDRVSGAQVTNSAQYLYYHPYSYIFNTSVGIEQIQQKNLDENPILIYFGYAVEDENFADKIIEETDFTNYTLIDGSIGVYLFE